MDFWAFLQFSNSLATTFAKPKTLILFFKDESYKYIALFSPTISEWNSKFLDHCA